MIRKCRDYLFEYITFVALVILYRLPHMYHPHVGLRGGWITLVNCIYVHMKVMLNVVEK